MKIQKKTSTKKIISFLKSAFKLNKRPAFVALSLIFIFLPGSNYYLDLKLKPTRPFIRQLSITPQTPSKYPIKEVEEPAPNLSARAAIIVDVGSAAVLFAKNSDTPLLPASTTKIMTAMVTLEHYPLDQVITVKKAHTSIGQTMDLVPGEQITVKNLLYGLLMHSGNDAAYALAENFPGGYFEFVNEMNILVKKFHLNNTQFANVSGIDQEGHFTTVSDLARLAAMAMKNPTFAEIVSKPNIIVTDINNNIVHPLSNRNTLLGVVEGIRGVKTGWTENAGECLVTNTIREEKEIITVVLGSNDRFGESKSLIEWVYRTHKWIDPNN